MALPHQFEHVSHDRLGALVGLLHQIGLLDSRLENLDLLFAKQKVGIGRGELEELGQN